MGRFFLNHPFSRFKKSGKIFALLLVLGVYMQNANAEVLNIPVKRIVATQPISTLEIISTVKTFLNGRVLSVKKKSTYTNPDCHYVKFLEDKGEFQLITIGCGNQNLARKNI